MKVLVNSNFLWQQSTDSSEQCYTKKINTAQKLYGAKYKWFIWHVDFFKTTTKT